MRANGLHTAEPHVWEEGYAGVGLTRAARICAAGHGGQVLLSRSTAGIVADDEFPGLHMRDLGAHRLAGLHWPEQIFQVIIDDLPADFPALNTPEGAGPAMETATVLTTDVVGLTAISESLAPGDFRALIAQCHQLTQAVFDEFDGYSAVSFADSTVATFRSPRAAIEAAATLQRRVAQLGWPGSVELRLRVGIDSGELMTTAYGPIGHPVNRCSRICTAARGGQTLVSAATRGRLDDRDRRRLDLLHGVEVGEDVYEIRAGAP